MNGREAGRRLAAGGASRQGTTRPVTTDTIRLVLLTFLLFGQARSAARSAEGNGDPEKDVGYREIPYLNRGLGTTDSPPNLTTPQATMESLIDSVAEGDDERARLAA